MSNEIATLDYKALVAYDPKVSLVDVRLDKVQFPRIGETAPEQALAIMKEIVISAYMYRGQEADDAMVDFTAANLVAELTDPNNGYGMQHLSWYEIARAIKRSLLGMGKEMYGISVASLYNACLEYVKTEGHAAEVKAAAAKHSASALPVGAQTMIQAKAVDFANALTQRTKEALR